MASESKADDSKLLPIELEHVIGYTGQQHQSLVAHPKLPHVVAYSVGTSVCVADLTDPHRQQFLNGHDANVCLIDIAPSGRLMASAQHGSKKRKGDVASVIVWHLKSAKIVFELDGLCNTVLTLKFSPDNKLLAASGANNYLIVWDLMSGERLHSEVTQGDVTMLAWAPVAPGKNDRPIYRLLAASDRIKHYTFAFDPHSMAYRPKAELLALPSKGLVRTYLGGSVDAAGEHLVVGTDAGDLLWFSLSALCYRASISGSKGGVQNVVYVGNHIFVGGGDGSVLRLKGSGSSWAVDKQIRVAGSVTSMSPSANGSELVVGTNAGNIFRVASADLKCAEVAESHSSSVVCVAFAATPDIFCTLSRAGKLLVWDLADYSVRARASVKSAGRCASFLKDGTILTGWEDGCVRAFQSKDGALLWEIPNAHRGAVTCVSACSKYVATGGKDGVVRLWEPNSRKNVTQYTAHKGPVRSLLIDVKYDHLIHTCGDDRSIVSYNVQSEKRMFDPHSIFNGHFNTMVQRIDGELELITGDTNGSVKMWDCDGQPPVKENNVMTTSINSMSLSPDGTLLAAGGDHAILTIYNTKDLKIVATLSGHSASINGIEWSPDQKQLVTVGANAAVSVWNYYG